MSNQHSTTVAYTDNIKTLTCISSYLDYCSVTSPGNMKAVVEARVPSTDFGIHDLKISKGKFEDGAEMTACFHKLKDLVPTVNHGQKISKKDLLQHVIDYILDLELALEFPPTKSTFSQIGNACRSPLSEKQASNSILTNLTSIDYEMEVTDIRPVSK